MGGGGDKGIKQRYKWREGGMDGGREGGEKNKERVLWYHHALVSLGTTVSEEPAASITAEDTSSRFL
jgi:hypothetical protein